MTKDGGGGLGRGGDSEEVGELDNIPTLPTSLHLCWGPRKISLRRKIPIEVGDGVLWTGWGEFSFPPDLQVSHVRGDFLLYKYTILTFCRTNWIFFLWFQRPNFPNLDFSAKILIICVLNFTVQSNLWNNLVHLTGLVFIFMFLAQLTADLPPPPPPSFPPSGSV